MKILKEPNCLVKCSLCGCQFEFNPLDVYNATGGSRKGNPIDPHKAVRCPFCNSSIPIWKKDEIQLNEYTMCSTADMAIYILEFIKQGYKRKYQDAGVQKYIEALEMGIDALKKKEKLKPVPFKRTAHDFCNGVCEHSHYPCEHLKIYNNEYQYTDYKCPSCNKIISDGTPNNCCHCGQTLDWSKE